MQNSSILPEQASNFAGGVDALTLYILGTSLFFALLVVVLVVIFSLKYRRKKQTEIGVPVHGSVPLEIVWTLIPLVLAMVMFAWGAVIYMDFRRAPSDTLDVYVIGKQWMWKLQHTDGRREINELHVPVGRNVKLIMASEDVIHDFSIPNFRIKMDVVPGRYTTLWFRATKTGRYHFYCSQYCGTSHALMTGWVTVMEPAEYAAWLSGGAQDANPAGAGEKLFTQYSCNTCHLPTGKGRGPSLVGLYGSKVKLADGTTVQADDAYVRESILSPKAKIVAGYQPLMPSFQGLVTEEQVLSLTAYIKSLQAPAPASEAPAEAPHMGKK
ncbi:MAG: cytochrome c oxidase subunit II [Acidobacteriia bacterium]|nr:cytochrome c oxidase subunit II [Terriglobia bacterium]